MFSFFNEGISFILLILLANYIAPGEYGKLSLFNTVVTIMGYFIALSSQGFVSISYFKRDTLSFRQDFSSICFICLFFSSIFCLINILFGGWIAKVTDLTVTLLWIAISIAFFKVFQETWLNIYRIKEEIVKYGIISCGFALLNLIFSLFLVIKTPLNWQGRIYAQLGCIVIFGLLAIGFFIKNHFFTSKISLSSLKLVVCYGLPLIPHLAALWLKQGGDRLIINKFHSIEDVGIYSFALNLTSIIVMVGNSFNNSNSVSIFKILSEDLQTNEKINLLKRQTRSVALITITIAIAIVACIGVFTPILLPNYVASLPYFFVLSLQGIGQCIYFLYCNYFFYYMKTKILMFITIGTSILHVVLSIWLTRYSLFCTCIIYVLSQAVITSLVIIISQRLLKKHLIEEDKI